MPRPSPLPLPFHAAPAFIGMVHLPALPGAPNHTLTIDRIVDEACRDARALIEGGADGLLVENFGDVPFFGAPVPPETVAALTRVTAAVCDAAAGRPVGVNVLRNDAQAALAIAAATGARFIRVNVHTGTMWTDQGRLTGQAAQTLRLRRTLCPEVAIFADVHVKHATPITRESFRNAARDAWERGLADALIVTGSATGSTTDPTRVARLAEALPEAPIWVGSGVGADHVVELEQAGAHGFIVGSSLRRDGLAGAPVDPERLETFTRALAGCRAGPSTASPDRPKGTEFA